MPKPGSSARRGYGSVYRKARAAILGPSGNGNLPADPQCHWWPRPGCTRVATTADHVPPIEVAGMAHLNLVPACKPCNDGHVAARDPKPGEGTLSRAWW